MPGLFWPADQGLQSETDKANDKNGDSATGILSSSVPNSSSQEAKLLVYYCLM